MTDLARQVAETAAGLFGDDELIEEEKWIGLVTKAINSVGTLVSHEQAALLREVERMVAQMDRRSTRFNEFVISTLGQTRWRVRYDWGIDAQVGRSDTLTAALKSALDAAGVPDAKGT